MNNEIGFFPCVKRLMVIVQLLAAPTALLIMHGVMENNHWNEIVNGRQSFPNLDGINKTFFNGNVVKLKNTLNSVKLEKVWSDLARKTALGYMAFGILVGFLGLSFIHFIAFCYCRELCFSRRVYRSINYILYLVGCLIFLGTGGAFAYESFAMNWFQYSNIWMINRNAAIPSNDFIYIGSSDSTNNTSWSQLTKSQLNKITNICFHHFLSYILAILDFQHVYPTLPVFPMSINGIFYHHSELTKLGFCHKYEYALQVILLSLLGASICFLVPIIGCCQFSNTTFNKIKKVNPSKTSQKDDNDDDQDFNNANILPSAPPLTPDSLPKTNSQS